MKNKIVLLVSAIALLLTSCGGVSSSSKNKGGKIDSQTTANKIIEYNNKVVKYMNETNDKIDKTSYFLGDMDEIIKSKTNRHTTMNFSFVGIKLRADKILVNVPKIISEEFKKNLKELDKNYQLLESEDKVLKKYRGNQDYKDDNWKKGSESVAKMNQAVENYYKYQNLIFKELKVVGDQAEEKVLENHPLKAPILAAKKDITLATDLRELLFAKKLDRDAIKIAYDLLEKSSVQHKEEFNKILTEQGKKNSYDSFHEEINDFLGEVRKTLRFNRELKTSDFNSISVDFESIIGGYNSFVG